MEPKFSLKTIPADFIVSESLVLPYQDFQVQCKYYYYKLYKKGVTTFDAVDELANYFQLNSRTIQYAGLKDEDGITEQLISLESSLDETKVIAFNCNNSKEQIIKLSYVDKGNFKISIGELNGNSFRVVVRKLPVDLFYKSKIINKKHNFFFINYYDTQRFGLPSAPQFTHLIGEAILNKKYDLALSLVKKNGSSLSVQASNYIGESIDFFNSIDTRKLAFFYNAYSSFIWNNEVLQTITDTNEDIYSFKDGTLDYIFTNQEKIRQLLFQNPSQAFKKFNIIENEIVESKSSRPTVIQSQLFISDIEADELNEGFYKIETNFFLPSGCYATNLVKQFFFNYLKENAVDINIS